MNSNNPKSKGKKQENTKKNLVNDKSLERNIQIEISREFIQKNKGKEK